MHLNQEWWLELENKMAQGLKQRKDFFMQDKALIMEPFAVKGCEDKYR